MVVVALVPTLGMRPCTSETGHAPSLLKIAAQTLPSQSAQNSEAAIPANLPPAERAERKLNWIAVNGERTQPNMTPTELSEDEINAYFASGGVKLPKGVHQVRF